MKQKIFTEEFANSLIYDIEDNLPKYKSGDFGNLKDVENEWSVECSGELLDKMLPYAVSGASNEFPAAAANQLEGLYWMVRRSVIKGENGLNDYTLSKFLFSRTKLGNRGLAASKLFSYENAVHGILRFYMENESTLLTPHFEEKTDYCIQLLNQTGAVVELSLWTSQDFYDFLYAHREQINRIIDRKVQKRLDEEMAQGQLKLNIE